MAYIVYRKFGFENIKVNLSTRPANSMGNDASWDKATQALRNALENAKIEYTFQEGEGAFYGPKIDLSIEDSMGRQWQCGTIQADFTQPENFDLSYIAAGGAKERPVMLHRTLYGSLERFFGILLEHHKGKLPFWIAPVQIKVLTITDEQEDYARAVVLRLKQEKMRAELDESSDQISAKIKTAQLEYVPWMVVIGAKEVANNTVTLRHLDGKQEFGLTIEQLLAKAATHNV
jgi:threonyl-tRNA synthetase